MKVKALKFTKNHGFHGNGHFLWKKANFTENVTAVKSWIRLVPSDQCWRYDSHHAGWLLCWPPLAQCTYQSNNSTACLLSRRASWLVLQRCVLTASDFHQSRLQTNNFKHADIAIDQQGRQSGAVVTVVMSICGLQRLSRASAEPGPGWPAGHPTKDCNNCLWSHLWVICRWHCLLRCHNYCAPPSVWPLCACCQSLSDQLTWLTSRHLTRWLCANSVGLWGTGCS